MSLSNQEWLFLVLGAGAVVLVIWTLKDSLKKNEKLEIEDTIKTVGPPPNNVILPLQLQAYERMVLFVDRIAPQNLISRVNQPGFTVLDMQLSMISSIRAEYDHNVSQQIYISQPAWEAIKTVKEQTISIINQMALKLAPEAPALELNKQILELFMHQPVSPSDIALDIINSEAKRLMQQHA